MIHRHRLPAGMIRPRIFAGAAARCGSAPVDVARRLLDAVAVQDIRELCAIAGQPGRAAAFIADALDPAEVRRILAAERGPTPEPPMLNLLRH